MKSRFFILMLFALIFSVSAYSQTRAGIMTGSGDTLVNTATKDLLFKVTTSNEVASFQVVNTKLSGTVAGSSFFQASNDGVNFINLDTLVNTNVTTNTKFFVDSPTKYLWYRIRWTGSGTMSAIPRGFVILRR